MVNHEYKMTTSNHFVFVKRFSDGDFIILLLYVDDMLIIGHDANTIKKLKGDLSRSFSMKDQGHANKILGMKITCDRKNDKLLLSHEMYIEKVLEMFNMSKTKPVRTPLANHFNLSSMQCPKSDKKKE